jgi:thioesterase domain-containing protein
VAHAIATELQSMDEEVALLALLDSYPSGRDNSLHGNNRERTEEVLFAGVADPTVRNMLDILRREGHNLTTLQEHHYEAITDAFNNNTRLMRKFVPQRFRGDVSLFVATEGRPTPPSDIWRPYVGGHTKVHRIDCGHDNMMDPAPAAKIGNVLASEIDRQRATSNAPPQRRTS